MLIRMRVAELLADTKQKSQMRTDLKGAFLSDLCPKP